MGLDQNFQLLMQFGILLRFVLIIWLGIGIVLVSHSFAVSKICFELRKRFCNKSRDRQRFIFLQLRARREQHRFLIVCATDF